MGRFVVIVSAFVVVAAVLGGLWMSLAGRLHNSTLSTDHTPIVNDNRDAYDFIVVGSGSAGSVLALRLSEAGQRVLVLEAGESDEGIHVAIPAASPVLQRTSRDWQYKTVPQTRSSQRMIGGQVNWPRGRMIGGSSSLNYMLYVRGHREDYNEWASKYNATGWGHRDMLPYFLKSEGMTIPSLAGSQYHNATGPLTVSGLRYVHGASKAFVQAAREFGIQETDDYNSHQNQGVSLAQVTQRDGQRCSAAVAFLRPALKRFGPEGAKTLTVAGSATVTRLLFDERQPTKVIGVAYKRGQGPALRGSPEYKVFAKREVILSAGAINTPQIMLLSGLGPAEQLKKFGIEVVRDLPAVGQNLQDHPAACTVYTIQPVNRTTEAAQIATAQAARAKGKRVPVPAAESTEPAINEDALSAANVFEWATNGTGQLTTSGFEVLAFLQTGASDHISGNRPDVELHFGATGGAPMDRANFNFDDATYNPGYVPPKYGMYICPVLLHPVSRGSITLNSTDPLAHPLIDPNYFASDLDRDALVQALKISHQISKMPALFKFQPVSEIGRSCPGNPHEFGTTAYWQWLVANYAATCYHPTSTARMGTNKQSAAVDLELRPFGVQGMRVVDASVFPTVPGGNTNAPVIAVAEKAADMIVESIKAADALAAAQAKAEAKQREAEAEFLKSTPPPKH